MPLVHLIYALKMTKIKNKNQLKIIHKGTIKNHKKIFVC